MSLDVYFTLSLKIEGIIVDGRKELGHAMYQQIEELFPNARSIVGPQIRKDFRILCNNFDTKSRFVTFNAGTNAGMWTVPKGWKLNYATLNCATSGKQIIDTRQETNLRIWINSKPFKGIVTKSDLMKHIKYHPDNPEAIPYVTCYYHETWGFSMAQSEIKELCQGPFLVDIQTEDTKDPLEIMMIHLPGKSKQEILFSSYLCHPSMANNELSGPVVMAFLIKWLEKQPRNYSYRFIFGPETIGPICLINQSKFRRQVLSNNLHAFNVNCVGAGKDWSFLPSSNPNDYTSQIVRYFSEMMGIKLKEYSYSKRGSDERQYNSPRAGLNMVSVMRSKYHEYPEYHTNLDNLDLITPETLKESLDFYCKLIEVLDGDEMVNTKLFGEPMVDRVLNVESIGGQSHHGDNFRNLVVEIAQLASDIPILKIFAELKIPVKDGFKIVQLLKQSNVIGTRPVRRRYLTK